jgi:hypothetical protein
VLVIVGMRIFEGPSGKTAHRGIHIPFASSNSVSIEACSKTRIGTESGRGEVVMVEGRERERV